MQSTGSSTNGSKLLKAGVMRYSAELQKDRLLQFEVINLNS